MPLHPTFHRALAMAALATALLAPPSRAATAIDSSLVNPVTYRIEPTHPCPGDTLYLVADLCAPCGQFVSMGMFESTMRTEVFTRVGANCPAQPCPVASRGVKLGAYTAGTHTLGLTTIVQSRYPDSTTHATRLYSSITWEVGANCPPPPPVAFPVVLTIQAPASCDTCAPVLCRGDSLRVRVQGGFPNGCYAVNGLRTLPVASPSDPPIVVLDVTWRSQGPCPANAPVFSESIALSPQPVGTHVLRLLVQVTDLDSVVTIPTRELARRFTVVDSCAPVKKLIWHAQKKMPRHQDSYRKNVHG